MRFRPCIDIHNGKVKQIVGGTLLDAGNHAEENFVSEMDAKYYALFYQKNQIKGGHVILLNKEDSMYYEDSKQQALEALHAYKKGLQVGGGINLSNATLFLDAGASHVIVTSYVFQNGVIHMEHLKNLKALVGKEQLVLDLSCREKDGEYYIVTNRWQTFTNVKVNQETLDLLKDYCDEFLVHAVDVEGRAQGIEKELVSILGKWGKIPITYAGGVGSFKDLKQLKELGNNKLDVTIGSALDLFGGTMPYQEVLDYIE